MHLTWTLGTTQIGIFLNKKIPICVGLGAASDANGILLLKKYHFCQMRLLSPTQIGSFWVKNKGWLR